MKNKHKARNKLSASNLHRHLCPVYLALAGVFPTLGEAATIADPTQSKGPTMGQTANGTPMVNIANPNAKGVSLNKFQEFNVDKQGMVFNNSTSDGVTKIGGYAIKNAQLQQEASAIISEVTGAKGSYINGTMEVFGKKADIVIANQNGITVNGASTLNANSLTLSTGKVQQQADGSIKLAVEKGAVALQGQGISTDGLGYFDIVSRSAKLEGEIAGKADINVIAGLNDYDTQTREHKVRSKGDASTPAVAIDGSALGSMYGGRVQLISTESGAGVRHAGSIIASNDIQINAEGDIVLTGLRSDKNISVTGNEIALQKNSVEANNDIVLKALSGMTVSGNVVSHTGTIRIDATSLVQNAASLITDKNTTSAIPAIQITVAGQYTLNGKLTALDATGNPIAGGVVTLKDGDFIVLVNNKPVGFSSIVSDAQIVSNGGDININAGSMNNNKGSVLAKKGTLQVNLNNALETSGYIEANGEIRITSGAAKNNGVIYSSGMQTLRLGKTDNAGRLFSDTKLVMNASSLNNTGKIGVSRGDMQLNTAGNLTNSGTISADDAALTLNSDAEIDNSGNIISNKNDVTLAAKGKSVKNQGKIEGRKVTVNANGADASVNNSGNINAKQQVQIQTAKLSNTGGEIGSSGGLDLKISQQLMNTQGGTLLAEGTVDITGAENATLTNEKGGWIQGRSINAKNMATLNNIGDATLLATDTLTLSGLALLNNNSGTIQAARLNLNDISNLTNTAGATLYAENSLDMSGVDTLLNSASSIVSDGTLSLKDIDTLSNTLKGLIFGHNSATLQNIDALNNNKDAVIQSANTLNLSGITTLVNSENAALLSNGNIALDKLGTLDNQSAIIGGSTVSIENSDTLLNRGAIQAGTDLIIRHIRQLANDGQDNVMMALRNLTIEDVDSLTNANGAVITANMSTILNAIGELINKSAGVIQAVDGALNVVANTLSNQGHDTAIVSGGNTVINATTLENRDGAVLASTDGNVDINVANKLANTNNAIISAARTLTLDAQHGSVINDNDAVLTANNIGITATSLFNNTNSAIIASNNLDIDTVVLDNTNGTLSANNTLNLDLDTTLALDNNNSDIVAGKKMNINTLGGLINNANLEVIGDLTMNSKMNFINNASILTGGNLNISAYNITNGQNALLWSFDDMSLDARNGNFTNQFKGNVMSIGDISIIANEIWNYAGVIRSEQDINLDAKKIKNESTYTGGGFSASETQDAIGTYKIIDKLTTKNTYTSEIHIPIMSSDISLDELAEISAGGNININQRDIYKDPEQKQSVRNEGGNIQASKDITITGDLYNSPKYTSQSILDYLKLSLSTPIKLTFNWNVAVDHTTTWQFDSVYQYIDFVFGNGVAMSKSGSSDGDKERMYYSLLDAANKAPLFNNVLNIMFGENWSISSYSTLCDKWSAIDTGSNTVLVDSMQYYVPLEKGEIAAGKNFTHNGGNLDNGLAGSSVIKQNAAVTTVEVGDKTIDTLTASYTVNVNTKTIEKMAMGISPMPVIKDLVSLPGLFAVSDEFKKAKMAENNGTPYSPPANNIIPIYETRPNMIDQSAFTGSDYFFNAVGYVPDAPINVIGDNYFTSELIRRELNNSVGNFFSVRDGLEGDALIESLMDNAGVASKNAQLNLVIGEPLTEEQRNNLDQDIVWFVNQNVNGVDVMVPMVYLSQATLNQMATGEVNGGTATIHANGNVNVDAESINNMNGSLSSGGDMALKAENDINNVSSGMNTGINAKGNIDMTSTSGDINNSGAAIKADGDIAMSAENGDITMTASMGRSEDGRQIIHAYEDGVSAGGSITMKAKTITSNASDITAGNDITLEATEGDVTFNDLHQITASREITTDINGAASYVETDKMSASGEAIGVNVSAGGNLKIKAKNDVVMEGGSYSAETGEIEAGNNVNIKTSQDVYWDETKTRSREFIASAEANGFGQTAKAFTGTNNGSFDSTSSGDYESAGGNSDLSNTGKRRPGRAPTSDTLGFRLGMETVTEKETNQSLVNKNAKLSFGNSVSIAAGKTADIGGANITAVNDIDIDAEEIATTKYADEHKSTSSREESFVGISGEAHSSVIDSMDKAGNLVEKALDGQSVDAGMTMAQVAGDLTNLAFNDLAGASITLGGSKKSTEKSSTETSENITNLSAANINFNSRKKTELNGVNINAKENVVLNAGEGVDINAAKSTSSYETSGEQYNVGITADVGKGIRRGDVSGGVSANASGSKEHSSGESQTHTNSQINGGKVTVNTNGDFNMKGANITADTADLNVAGNTSIESVQDTVRNDKNRTNWGVSAGLGFSTGGLQKGTTIDVGGHGGGGSEFYDSAKTGQQSGIQTKDALNVNTQGDLNMKGAHLVSDNNSGSINVGKSVNATDLQDHVEQDGAYGGGGGGISFGLNGVPKGGGVNLYTDTVDEIHYSETQKATINVATKTGDGTHGAVNTDKDNMSVVTKDERIAGNNISATIVVPSGIGKSNKGSYDVDTPSNTGAQRPSHGTNQQSQIDTGSQFNNNSGKQPKPSAGTQSKSNAETQSKSSTDTQLKPDTDTQPKPGTDTQLKPDADTQPKPGTDTQLKPDAETQPKPGTDTQLKPDAETQPKPGTDTQLKPDAETQPKPEQATAADKSFKPDANKPAKKWPTPNTDYPVLSPGSATGKTGMVVPKTPEYKTWNGDKTHGVMPSSNPNGTDVKLSPGSSTGQTGMVVPKTPKRKDWNGDQTNGVMPSSDPNGTDVKLSPGSSTGQTGMDTPPAPEPKNWNGAMNTPVQWKPLMEEMPINIYAAVTIEFNNSKMS